MTHQVLLFYKYVTINNPKEVADWIRARSKELDMLGRVIVAEEGINATLEGTEANTEEFLRGFLKDPRFSDIQIKRSEGDGQTFPKLSVKVREEIVGTHLPKEVDPRVHTSKHLKPEELKDWFQRHEDFIIVDMRNDYEYEGGHFKNSVYPDMRASRDLPEFVEKLEPLKEKKVLTVCTGGIRCEKMSAYLLHKGFKDVYQLDGGIHTYMEKYPGQDFKGGLYTFDQRVMMNFGGDREIIGTCKLCAKKSEKYVNCANQKCHLHFIVCDDCSTDEHVFCSDECRTKMSVETSVE